MRRSPTAIELLDAVASLLEERVLPAADAALSHQVRVAAHLVRLVRRELSIGGGDAAERARLVQLVDPADAERGSLPELRAALAHRLEDVVVPIDSGEMDRIRLVLVDVVVDELEISKPGYDTWTDG